MNRLLSMHQHRVPARGRTRSAFHLSLATTALLLFAAGSEPASAQNAAADGSRQDCVVPEQPEQKPATSQAKEAKPSASAQLSDCDGVLKPPKVGDPEMVEPAPPVGDTPVIKPHELPRNSQAPQQGG